MHGDAAPSPSVSAEKKADPLGCLFVARYCVCHECHIIDDNVHGTPRSWLHDSLSSQRTDEQLQETVTHHFEQWGPLMSVKVMKGTFTVVVSVTHANDIHSTSHSHSDWSQRPYAFVQFENAEDAQRALVEANHNV